MVKPLSQSEQCQPSRNDFFGSVGGGEVCVGNCKAWNLPQAGGGGRSDEMERRQNGAHSYIVNPINSWIRG